MSGFIAINWGSSNFRAYRIAADGAVTARTAEPAGVATLDRAGMVRQVASLAERWPDNGSIYASGMIGSNVGWVEVPYAECPAGLRELAAAAVDTEIGDVPVTIVPGMTCRRQSDGAVDVLRGEEIELYGMATLQGISDGIVALPGTHTKWVEMREGRANAFLTSMSGEIYDRLTTQGLLASVVEGEAFAGEMFLEGVRRGMARQLGLGALLFGVRAQVVRGELRREVAASMIRGLLIGSDIADAMATFPNLCVNVIPLVGNGGLSALYAAALASHGARTAIIDANTACVAGFRALHELKR